MLPVYCSKSAPGLQVARWAITACMWESTCGCARCHAAGSTGLGICAWTLGCGACAVGHRVRRCAGRHADQWAAGQAPCSVLSHCRVPGTLSLHGTWHRAVFSATAESLER